MKVVVKICLWILAFIPLVVDHNVFFPFTSGKNLLIESCLILAGILILINFFYSREYREEVVGKVIKYIKHPLVISVFSFISIFIISTIFAVDKYSAFWGDLSRAEGLAGTMFFFAFFIFTLLTFEKEDWLWFFKLSLFTSLILLGKEFVEYFHDGISRPGSFAGNPTFLAGYLLFSVTSALIVLEDILKIISTRRVSLFQTGWLYLSVIVIILSILGTLITQTRGTILGLGLGIVSALIYCAFKGKEIDYKIFNLRKVAIILLSIGIIFSGIFAVTRKSEIWQKIPGLSRLALTSTGLEGDSMVSRLFIYKASLHALNPAENGLGKLLIGWGPDNYIIANSKYYDADQYRYETNWYDRAHNKFLDVLVMNGIFGLLAYLAIWFIYFASLKRNCEGGFLFTNLALLSFGVSFLIHLLFIFDQISTSISLFAILAFVTYLGMETPLEDPKKLLISYRVWEKKEILVGSFLFILTLFLALIYFKSTLLGYIQMRNYTLIIKSQNPITIDKEIDFVFTPFTLAQMDMRRNFMEVVDNLYKKNPNDFNLQLIKKSIVTAEEYIIKRPTDFGFMTTLANFYNHKIVFSKTPEFLKRGENLFNIVLSFSPNRPDINRGLAANLYYQKRFLESFNLFEKTFNLIPDYFIKDKSVVEGIYVGFIKYFYEQKDKGNFIKTVKRLKTNNYEGSASLNIILNYLDKNGVWPKVNFN